MRIKGFESFNRCNSCPLGADALFVPALLVGCGEIRTASIEVLGFNIGFGQQPDISSGFRQNVQRSTKAHSLMRFVPHHILPWLFGLKDFGPDQSNIFDFAPKR